MTDHTSELSRLRTLRRSAVLQLCIASVSAPLVVGRLWSAELTVVDARWLAGIGVALLSWVIVRTVADTAGLLEEPCPACGECFFGGLTGAAGALPLPPSECVHCRIGLDGTRPERTRASSRS